jgi:predicted AAA+ superfamily ATPase
MERKIELDLIQWKNSASRVPLVLYGARQVGKTYIVSRFAREHYDNFVYLNFEANIQLHTLFERDLSPVRILKELSVLMNTTIREENTLLFFDEIQSCEKALTSLKYFAEDAPGFHIIAAGSLLGVALHREKYSFPVGKVFIKMLYPLDFEEFLWALGNKDAPELIKECFETNSPCSLHPHFMDQFRIYLSLGGMPQVINTYLKTQNMDEVALIQQFIVNSYIADMAKYTQPVDTIKILAAYNSIPSQLAKENRKFQYKLIKSNARSHQYETAIDWLCASGIVFKCTKVTQGNYPLSVFTEPSFFKIFMGDVGLLCSKLGISAQMIQSENQLINHLKGSLAENYVANSLRSNGLESYYWESEGKAEVDFVIQTKSGECIAIEVKSSENVRSKSLQQFVLKYKPSYSIRISAKNFGFENNIKSLPLYAAFCIKAG